MIARIGVVIPARDEEERIARCLLSVHEAARSVDSPVTIVVIADGCLDRTAAVATDHGATVIEIDSSNVGNARAVGASWAISRGADWLANTDADSLVPDNWLATHLGLAAIGADVVVGTVRPEFSELSPEQQIAWSRTHVGDAALGHVHAANLGIRVSSYLASGGYRPLPEHEDNDLVARLSASNIVASAACEVITSGRAVGRTPGGYARYLREDLVAAAWPLIDLDEAVA